jgi:hypothetical protein
VNVSTRKVAAQFPHWSMGQCRAYRAGALAQQRGLSIGEGFSYDPEDDLEDDDLTLYFFRGYADALGDDAQGESWFDQIPEWDVQCRWWED